MRTLSIVGCLALLFLFPIVVSASEVKKDSEVEKDFVSLFDGKSLDGWSGDPELWCVDDGVIVGSTEGQTLKANSFLSTKKTYKNFILKVEFKLRNHNSGIQVRSEQRDDYVVAGYQADIAENKFMGILYEEKGRGILANVESEKVAKYVKVGDWNEYVITCDGPSIRQVLNGYTTVDYKETSDQGATEGIIAFQVHRGPEMKVFFRNIRIQELP